MEQRASTSSAQKSEKMDEVGNIAHGIIFRKRRRKKMKREWKEKRKEMENKQIYKSTVYDLQLLTQKILNHVLQSWKLVKIENPYIYSMNID